MKRLPLPCSCIFIALYWSYWFIEHVSCTIKRYHNSLHAAGMGRRQFKNVTKVSTKVKIVEYHDKIWNYHEKCIQISTNMPGIGSLIHEIHVKITKI